MAAAGRSTCALVVLFLLLSCATRGRQEQRQLRQLIAGRAPLEEIVTFVANSKFYRREDSRLLYHLELGRAYHIYGKYQASVIQFSAARQLARKLYTESLSKKAQKLILNDNYDIYYGEKYEHSLIRFYLSLNRLLIAQKGSTQAWPRWQEGKIEQVPGRKLSAQEARSQLQAARAELVDWDSYLKELRYERAGRSVFKSDMLAKTYGALVHETLGTSNDWQVARQLYKDGKLLLLRNYNGYKSFNAQALKFKRDFAKLPGIGRTRLEKDYLDPTSRHQELQAFLDKKIMSAKKRKLHNVKVVLQSGMIPIKYGKPQYYGLGAALNDPKASDATRAAAAIGIVALSAFAVKELGLLPPPENYQPVGAHLGIHFTQAAIQTAAISFELPAVDNLEAAKPLLLSVRDLKGKEVYRGTLPLINPLGDIAEEAIAEHSAARYSRIGLRLAGKYLAAIVTTYTVFKKTDNALARSAALLAFAATTGAIGQSERADTRYWSLLPREIRLTDFSLPPGEYRLLLLDGQSTLHEENFMADRQSKMLNIQLPGKI